MHSFRASADPRISDADAETRDTRSDGPPLHEEPVGQKHRFSILDHLSRKTTSGRFIPEIDSLRFVAIAMVVLYHLAGFVTENDRLSGVRDAGRGWFYDAASHGHYGVQLFFMISGFVLALPFATQRLANGRPVGLRAYFLRRLTRLEPPYVIAMIGFALILAARHRYPVDQIQTHLGASLLYLHNLV
jgi:peptidoglycan/LPS O-acetylase OafA/YrhL